MEPQLVTPEGDHLCRNLAVEYWIACELSLLGYSHALLACVYVCGLGCGGVGINVCLNCTDSLFKTQTTVEFAFVRSSASTADSVKNS